MPPEYVRTGRVAASTRSNCSRSSSARERTTRAGSCVNRPTMRRFSRPVRFSSTAANCPASPMLARTASGSRVTSRPSTRAVPPSGGMIVVRMRTAVVLPAPLGPRSPKAVPASTARSMPSRATTLP